MSNSQRRQMMQPWPLCLVSFSKTKEHNVLPKYYTRVPPVTRSVTNDSGINLDCSSNTTIATNASPFNSQTALIAEKKVILSGNSVTAPSNHYYAQNLRNNHQKTLSGSHMYDPLDKGIDHDYKQLDPLLVGEPPYTGVELTKPSMSSQNVKPTKDSDTVMRMQFQKEPKPSIMRYANQVLAALSVSMCSMVVGYSSSYTSPGLVSMRDNATATFEVTKETGMWIGSIMPLSALFGGMIGGPSIEYLGRRNTILATALPFIAAWLLISLAANVAMVLAGRALCGFCVGIASLSLPVYLGETIQAEVRGTLGLLPTAFGNTGILVCFIAGMYLDWRNLALLGAALPIPFMILMFVIPETPRWYISKGKTKRARKSLQWLRGKGTDITDELSSVQKLHTESERNVSQGAFMQLFKKNHLKPLFISLGLMFFQQFSGINAVIFYTVQIFRDAGSSIDENISTIVVGIVNFISTFVAASVIDRLGRKMLLYISAISMCLTLFTFGTFFYVKATGVDVTAFGWIPLMSLIVYVIGFSLGFGPIPWLMMGEILPVKIRGSANVRDSDTSLWLHNKLGTSNDSWTGSSICSQLNAEVLRNIKDCFPDLQTQVKLKLLLSFFHIPRRNVEEWRVELEEIIEVASLDSELWVSMLSEAMKTFPSIGSLNTDITDLDEHRPIFGELVNDLRKLLKKQNDPAMLPLECHYLNKTALTSVVGQQPTPVKHFTLKRKPKSAALRAELLQKSTDAASNLKKSTAPTVPVRSRGMPRKMTDTTPLKGIPSRVPPSGFRSPSLTSSSMSNRTPLSNRMRKDGGIKLLDINEQPLGYAQAKKRKRMIELEEQQKKVAEAQAVAAAAASTVTTTTESSTTPEYAQGLTSINPPATPITPVASIQSYTTSTPPSGAPAVTTPQTPTTPSTPSTPSTVLPVATPTVITPVESTPVGVQTVRPAQTVTQIRIQTTAQPANAAANTRKGLSLTREQMLEAQEMFRTANKVTRPEKALILGFMAGSRDNPCPKLGNIVTVMLSENIEEVTQPDGTSVPMLVETHFQMNYTNGEWKRIKKNRRIVTEESTSATTPASNATATASN